MLVGITTLMAGMQQLTRREALDNDLALADIGELKGALVSVSPEAGVKGIHRPTQVAHRQTGPIRLPFHSTHTIQVLNLQQQHVLAVSVVLSTP